VTGIDKVVLAYSGGLDTSIILKWIKQAYDCEVVALTADLGQEEELDGLEEKAEATGAIKARIQDLREEFARDFVFPALRAGAVYEGRYLLGTSLARPLITKQMVEVAREEGAQAIAHGATGKGNDQVRFELAAMALAPDLQVIAPWREWELASRSDLLAFARENGIPLPGGEGAPYSCDRNLMHLSFEGGELEDPWQEPGPGTYVLTAETNPGYYTMYTDAQGRERHTIKPKNAIADQAEEITLSLYSKQFAKTYVVCEEPSAEFPAHIGLPLELVPTQDISKLQPGDTLELKVHLNGQPYTGQGTWDASLNGFSTVAGDNFYPKTKVSGDMVRIPIPHPGRWYVRYYIKVDAQTPEQKEKYSQMKRTATLVFQIPNHPKRPEKKAH